jgi:hypothetical protein
VTLSFEQVKERMIRDTILLVDPLPFDRDALFQVLQRRLTKTTQGTTIPLVNAKQTSWPHAVETTRYNGRVANTALLTLLVCVCRRVCVGQGRRRAVSKTTCTASCGAACHACMGRCQHTWAATSASHRPPTRTHRYILSIKCLPQRMGTQRIAVTSTDIMLKAMLALTR